MKKIKYFMFVMAILAVGGWGPFSFFSFGSANHEQIGSKAWLEKELQIIGGQADNFDPKVLKLALKAYAKARQQGLDEKGLLTIVDYDKSSVDRRLLVVDVKNDKVLFNTWVSHGRNSGKLNATSFSNKSGSLKSSIGVFLTTRSPYQGENGYSLRVQGLEQGINDNAFRRDIVFHGAWYADPNVGRRYGALGRSWGCFAVGQDVVKPLIDTIKDNTLVVAYYPDRHWLNNSTYVAG